MTPISLFASITETSSVSSRIAAATASGSSRPACGLGACSTPQQRHLEALAGQPSERIEDRLVFGGDRNQMIPAPAVALGRAADGQIVALGGAAGEHDLARLGADGRGDATAGVVDRLFRLPAEGVAGAGRVAVDLA